MQEKLQWETPQIYSLDQNKIRSGQSIVAGTENQRAIIFRTDNTSAVPGNYTAGQQIALPAATPIAYYTANGTACNSIMLNAQNDYLLIIASQNNTTMTSTAFRNYVAANFQVSCP